MSTCSLPHTVTNAPWIQAHLLWHIGWPAPRGPFYNEDVLTDAPGAGAFRKCWFIPRKKNKKVPARPTWSKKSLSLCHIASPLTVAKKGLIYPVCFLHFWDVARFLIWGLTSLLANISHHLKSVCWIWKCEKNIYMGCPSEAPEPNDSPDGLLLAQGVISPRPSPSSLKDDFSIQ